MPVWKKCNACLHVDAEKLPHWQWVCDSYWPPLKISWEKNISHLLTVWNPGKTKSSTGAQKKNLMQTNHTTLPSLIRAALVWSSKAFCAGWNEHTKKNWLFVAYFVLRKRVRCRRGWKKGDDWSHPPKIWRVVFRGGGGGGGPSNATDSFLQGTLCHLFKSDKKFRFLC